jgi:hypothetical protein
MPTIKCVYIKSNLQITGGFSATDKLFPSQFEIVEQEDGSVMLYPLEDSPKQEMHSIPASNVACITYELPMKSELATITNKLSHNEEVKPAKKAGRPRKTVETV